MRYEFAPSRRSPRRGVLLLVILGLLTMFGLVALSFVMVAGQFRRGAEAVRRIDVYYDPPRQVLEEAFAQVVRGSNSLQSAIGPHSLLEDMYGNGSRAGAMTSPAQQAGLIEFQAQNLSPYPEPVPVPLALAGCPRPLMMNFSNANSSLPPPHHYVGSVLTILNGPCAGASTRIVGLRTAGNLYYFQILAVDGISLLKLQQTLQNYPAIFYLVNGPAFSGTGFGRLVQDNPGEPPHLDEYALLPGARGDPRDQDSAINTGIAPHLEDPITPNSNTNAGGWCASPGGANEDYDAPDYQNMLLAYVVPPSQNGHISVPIPSMHRSELVKYWQKDPRWGMGEPKITTNHWNFRKQVILRGDPKDQTYKPYRFVSTWDGRGTGATWDVDNDGDGVPDSIWVDLGMPVRADSLGRLYKPLFAILCVDLDGRLNVNAHGSPELLTASQVNVDTTYARYAGGTPPTVLPVDYMRGQGSGPPKVRLEYGLAAYLPAGRSVQGLYQARYGGNVPYMPGALSPLMINKLYQCRGNYNEFFGTSVISEIPTTYSPDAYGAPLDFTGEGAVGLDVGGHPYYYPQSATFSPKGKWVNNPYDINLDRKSAWRQGGGGTYIDNPFTPAELERVLRMYDVDSGVLPPRLTDLLGLDYSTAATNPLVRNLRNVVTSESWDVPCPSANRTAHMMNTSGQFLPVNATLGSLQPPPFGGTHVVDLAMEMLRVLYGNQPASQWDPCLRNLFPPDLLCQLRMNLNWPLGNGRDDNNNKVVDDPDEDTLETYRQTMAGDIASAQLVDAQGMAAGGGAVRFDSVNRPDLSINPTYVNARQLMARYLYVLATLLSDTRAIEAMPDPWSTAPPPANQLGAAGRARMLAQWAVNVVDFYDRDSIMTCFEYDPYGVVGGNNKFTGFANVVITGSSPDRRGWRVDGNPATNDGITANHVVWGCEKPPLLIMETLAFHDRRTQDTDEETDLKVTPTRTEPGKTTDTEPQKKDPHFDQKLVPQGSLFVKLFNPASPTDAPQGEFEYDLPSRPGGWQRGISLNQTSRVGGSPVWRMIITLPRSTAGKRGLNDPDDPVTGVTSTRPTVERSVYFVDPTTFPATSDENTAVRYFPDTNFRGQIAPILPGRYGVVGSGRPQDNGQAITFVGMRNVAGNPTADSNTRQIVLAPSANPESPTLQVDVRQNKSSGSDMPSLTRIERPVAIVINSPRRLSVSEPTSNYYETQGGFTRGSGNDQDSYSSVHDIPVDHQAVADNKGPTGSARTQRMQSTGTVDGFRMIHLQRLANPLKAYDATTNPYITVDSAPVDLTCFNGASKFYDPVDPLDKNGSTTVDKPSNVRFVSRERGERNLQRVPGVTATLSSGNWAPVANRLNLWAQEPVPYQQTALVTELNVLPQAPTVPADGRVTPASGDQPPLREWRVKSTPQFSNTTNTNFDSHFFQEPLVHTLGFLNSVYCSNPLNVTNAQYTGIGGSTNSYKGYPLTARGAFSWLPWNNRPFTSPMELMLVPWTSPSRLLNADVFSLNHPLSTAPNDDRNPYQACNSTTPPGANPGTVPFYHTLNFFDTAAQFHRILDYVRVPSQFAGTEMQLSPSVMQSGQHWFHPPFHAVSTYREPGRININTISDPNVWYALMDHQAAAYPSGNTNGALPTWGQYLLSRRGGTAGATSISGSMVIHPSSSADTINFTVPTRFENPFRGGAGYYFTPKVGTMPTESMLQTAIGGEVGATLLRPLDRSNATFAIRPMFNYRNTAAYANSFQNEAFRYQGFNRLANMVTTRSNVYAVWITVGYFAASAGGSVAENFPERNDDSGDISRHRAFYIFDRSVPMGFVRGQDLNYEKGVLVRRQID